MLFSLIQCLCYTFAMSTAVYFHVLWQKWMKSQRPLIAWRRNIMVVFLKPVIFYYYTFRSTYFWSGALYFLLIYLMNAVNKNIQFPPVVLIWCIKFQLNAPKKRQKDFLFLLLFSEVISSLQPQRIWRLILMQQIRLI